MKFTLDTIPTNKSDIDALSVQNVIDMYEQLNAARRSLRDEIREGEIETSFNSLIVGLGEDAEATMESLTDQNIAELAHVLGTTETGVRQMNATELIDKCDALVAGNEVVVESAIAGLLVYMIAYVAVFSVIVIAASMVEASGYDFESLYLKLEQAFKDRDDKTMFDDITVTTFTHKQFSDQIQAINTKVLPILKQDPEKIYKEDYPIKQLEAAASALWAAPDAWVGVFDGEYNELWRAWSDDIPARTRNATFKELGFTFATLRSTSEAIGKLCREMIELHKRVKASSKASNKAASKGNIFERIVNWWRDDKATKEEKARLRNLARAKHTAIKALATGSYEIVTLMASDVLLCAKKVETLVKKA